MCRLQTFWKTHLDVLVVHVDALLLKVVPQLGVDGHDQKVGDVYVRQRLQAASRHDRSQSQERELYQEKAPEPGGQSCACQQKAPKSGG